MKRTAMIFLCALMTACASDPMLTSWSEGAQKQAKAGEIKWSQYYNQLYDRVANSNLRAKAGLMDRTAYMANAAKNMEDGFLEPANFATLQRDYEIKNVAEAERDSERSRQAFGAALMNSSSQPVKRSAPTVNCTSNTYGNSTNTTCR